MPKVGCNGFSLFAEQMRDSLEKRLGKQLSRFHEVAKAAAPFWQKLAEDEKRGWKERARNVKRSDEYQAKKQAARIQQHNERRRCESDQLNGEDDESEDDEFGEYDNANFEDAFELPAPIKQPQQNHNLALFNCLPGGDFTWKKKEISPAEEGDMYRELANLQLGGHTAGDLDDDRATMSASSQYGCRRIYRSRGHQQQQSSAQPSDATSQVRNERKIGARQRQQKLQFYAARGGGQMRRRQQQPNQQQHQFADGAYDNVIYDQQEKCDTKRYVQPLNEKRSPRQAHHIAVRIPKGTENGKKVSIFDVINRSPVGVFVS